MFRRNFLQLLACVPFLGWLKPKDVLHVSRVGNPQDWDCVTCCDVWTMKPDGTYIVRSFVGEPGAAIELPVRVLETPDYPYKFLGLPHKPEN